MEERDQKVSVGLGGVPPWAFRHRPLLKTSLGSSPMPQLPVLPAGPSKPPENKIAAVGSKKRLPWSHNNILAWWGYLSSGVLPSRQSMVYRTILAHLLRRCTRLLMVLPSRQRSACKTSCDGTALQAAELCVPIFWHTSFVGVSGYSW